LEKVWKRFSRPAHCNSAARCLKQVMAHRPNGSRSTRPPATCLSHAHTAPGCEVDHAACADRQPPPTDRASPPRAPPPCAHLYPLHLPLDDAKKLFPSSFPCSPSSASLCAHEAVNTVCCARRTASSTGCRRQWATTPRLKSR
jgi:hypothetical protein